MNNSTWELYLNMYKKEWNGIEVKVEVAVQVIEYLRDIVDFKDKIKLKSVYRTLSELLLNIQHHAYPKSNNDTKELEKHWKISVSNLSNSLVSIIVEDYGITIPVSIIEKIKNGSNDLGYLKLYNDEKLIKEAIYPEIVKNNSGRGCGFKSILKDVDENIICNLSICSRDGLFYYNSPPQMSKLENSKGISGTSVEIIISRDSI